MNDETNKKLADSTAQIAQNTPQAPDNTSQNKRVKRPYHTSDSVFYTERDAAVYTAYLRVLSKTPSDMPFNSDKAISSLLTFPQPRFWVQPRTIYNILRKYHRGIYHLNDKSLKPIVRNAILAYIRIRNRREFRGKSLFFIADFVTAEPTKGFYLSKRRLADIIRRQKHLNFKRRCALALSGLQSYERHALLYGAPHKSPAP